MLAIDLGTGGPKIGLVSITGQVAFKCHSQVATRTLGDGGQVQDPNEWWKIICDAIREALSRRVVPADRVVAVAATGQWASTIPVNARGVPVGDCLMWMDTRGGPYSRDAVGGPIQGYAPRAIFEWVRRTGGAPSTSGADPTGHILFIENAMKDVASETAWYLEPVDYLSMRFTGVAAASHASMTA
ncbi:MAG TPA: FGGY family carbohydrate kinase, partial [Acidimicrobiales bacterium]|nr:FGGY family carbohydrate kinase [Acidimicrobiales bacterium]